ncbi:amidase [Rugamonas apoptosis]|uniref:Amidase n=1 Tax=Rugamonas apoptosis TaxID=2758570 RepID=A0A7W2F8K2_9BURK|nr:amidase [Rugamonas apoptosis]MBA5687057.1 amidase [Rugamonas apoptosis]
MTNISYTPATELLARFRAGTLDPVAVLDSLIETAQAQQATVNSAASLQLVQARAMALEARRRYADGTARPLEGVPVIVKEETAVKGWPRPLASLVFKDRVARENHPIIDKLLDAGAIPYFQSTNPEFCVLGHTWSKMYGVTRNPWALDYSCGGSSGGSGAALAAGVAPLATGSDMAGSIRLPSSLCGVYGFKPPFGRLACAAGDEYLVQAVEGPMTRTFDDLVLMQNVLAGPHPSSFTTLPYTPLPTSYGDLKGMRIAYSPAFGNPTLADDIHRNLMRALDGLRRAGAVVEEVELDWDLAEINAVLLDGLRAVFVDEFMRDIADADADQLCGYADAIRVQGKGGPASLIPSAVLGRQLHRDMHDKVWGKGYQAFICASMLTTDLPADQNPVAEPTIESRGHQYEANLGWCLTPPFNLLNRYPVLAAPTGLSDHGVPTGMQIVANAFDDETVFRVAANHAKAGSSALFVEQFPPVYQQAQAAVA